MVCNKYCWNESWTGQNSVFELFLSFLQKFKQIYIVLYIGIDMFVYHDVFKWILLNNLIITL